MPELSLDFLQKKLVHLHNKMTRITKRLGDMHMPEEHRRDKLALLGKVQAAIKKIDDGGNYGICIDCGESIPEERLRVRPEAERCVECGEKQEEDAQRRA